jgi:transglutaminase-like putative cysteine protease
VGEPASINVSHYHNLDESLRYHSIQLSVYDWDPIVDDKIDIHPDANMLDFTVVYDSVSPSEYLSFSTNGSGDGDAGLLEFSLLPFDYLGMTNIDYNWMFNGELQSLTVVSTYADYLMYRNMNHAIDWSNADSHADVISQYAAFATPEDPTIMGLADNLSQMATQHGYTSDLDVLRYIYAFVGLIPYAYDIDSTNYTEYPKYPVEMIYDQRGDCEDSSALFISLVEHLGYDAGLMLGTVKATEDDDWGGHAWPVVALENHSGWSVNGVGQKANLSYYFVESTAYYEGSSDIGINPWYDMANETFYDVGA